MNEFGLKFTVPGILSTRDAERTFYWPTSGVGSFTTDLTTRLGALGPVNALNADLVRFAVLVYAADRSVLRAADNVNWTSRDFALTVPVSNPSVWNAHTDALEHLLGFLAGDNWDLTFKGIRFPKEAVVKNQHPTAERVVLLSGGAGSRRGRRATRGRRV